LTTAAGICGLLAIFASFVRDIMGENNHVVDSDLVLFPSIACLLLAWISRGIAHAIFDIADCALHRNATDDE
jgi:hypothetical protein